VIHGSVADGVTKSAMSSILVFHPDKTATDARLEDERGARTRQEATLPA
jgi:hypothetical protein